MADVSDRRRSGSNGSRRFTAILMAVALSAQSTVGFAQTDEERAGARAAAQEGAKAFEESRWADAIDLFSRAQALVKAPPHLLYIARSHEKLGQLVKAREAYLKITREKIADDAPAAFREAQASAQKELAALEPRLPYVSVVVQGAGPLPVTVTMDGQKVPQALVGVPRPVDPGEHKFQGFAEKMETNVSTVSLREGARETVVLTLQEAAGGGAPVASAPNTENTKPVGGEPQADTTQSGTNSMRIASYAAFGVGAVGLIVGTIFTLKAGSKRGEADDLCNAPGGKCPLDKKDEIDSLDKDADSASRLGVIGFVVGGLGIGAGVTLFVLSNKKSGSTAKQNKPAGPSISPWIGVGSAGVTGRF